MVFALKLIVDAIQNREIEAPTTNIPTVE